MHGTGYQTNKADRAKAAGAAVIIHLLLGAAFLTGLALQPPLRSDDSLKTFDVRAPPPPPPPMTEAPSQSAKSQPAAASSSPAMMPG